MKRLNLFAALVLVAGASACERKSEPAPSETTTTSGTIGEEQEHPDLSGARSIPSVRAGDTTGAEPAGGGAGAMKAGETASEESLRVGGDAGIATERRDDEGLEPAAEKSKGEGQKSGESKAKGSSKAKGTTNESTTLGDGTSGQYTGGKGTYGGKATHGTGGDTDKK